MINTTKDIDAHSVLMRMLEDKFVRCWVTIKPTDLDNQLKRQQTIYKANYIKSLENQMRLNVETIFLNFLCFY